MKKTVGVEHTNFLPKSVMTCLYDITIKMISFELFYDLEKKKKLMEPSPEKRVSVSLTFPADLCYADIHTVWHVLRSRGLYAIHAGKFELRLKIVSYCHLDC